MIPPELASFLEEGIGIHLASRNAALQPNGVRAMAARVESEGSLLVVYLPTRSLPRLLPDFEANRQVAVVFGRPIDERSVQVKGIFLDVRDGRDDERGFVVGQWEGYMRNLGEAGIPRAVYERWPTWPCAAICLRVTSMFEQTPRPGTGGPIR